jgi:hypothetical protein
MYLFRAIIVDGRKAAVVNRKAREKGLDRQEGSPKRSKSFPSANSKLKTESCDGRTPADKLHSIFAGGQGLHVYCR